MIPSTAASWARRQPALDRDGWAAAHLRPGSRRKRTASYGRWLAWGPRPRPELLWPDELVPALESHLAQLAATARPGGA